MRGRAGMRLSMMRGAPDAPNVRQGLLSPADLITSSPVPQPIEAPIAPQLMQCFDCKMTGETGGHTTASGTHFCDWCWMEIHQDVPRAHEASLSSANVSACVPNLPPAKHLSPPATSTPELTAKHLSPHPAQIPATTSRNQPFFHPVPSPTINVPAVTTAKKRVKQFSPAATSTAVNVTSPATRTPIQTSAISPVTRRGTEQIFQDCRKQAVSKCGFLRYEVLERLVKETVGFREFQRDTGMRDLCNAMRRMLATINTVVDCVIATHNIITLHDLECHIILRLRDFANVASFQSLGLGALVCHDKIRQFFKPSTRLLEHAVTPRVTTAHVLETLAEEMRQAWLSGDAAACQRRSPEEQRVRVIEALNLAARNYSKGVGRETECMLPGTVDAREEETGYCSDVSWQDLGIFFKAEPLLVFLVSFGRRHAHFERKRMEKVLYANAREAAGREAAERLSEAAGWLDEQHSLVASLSSCSGQASTSSGTIEWRDGDVSDAGTAVKLLAANLAMRTRQLVRMQQGGCGERDGGGGAGGGARTLSGGRDMGSPPRFETAVGAGDEGLERFGSQGFRPWAHLSTKEQEQVDRWEMAMTQVVAPVLVCALLQLPAAERRVLADYDAKRQAACLALRAVLSDSTAGLDAVAVLLRAEKSFLAAIGATMPHEAPTSLVREIAAHQELRDLLEAHLASYAFSRSEQAGARIVEGGLEVEGSADSMWEGRDAAPQSSRDFSCNPSTARGMDLLESICVFLRECDNRRASPSDWAVTATGLVRGEGCEGSAGADDELTAADMEMEGEEDDEEGSDLDALRTHSGLKMVLTVLAEAELRVCELHGVFTFESVGGMSFAQFIAQPDHIAAIQTLMDELQSRTHYRSRAFQSTSVTRCPRLVQLLLLIVMHERALAETSSASTSSASCKSGFNADAREDVVRILDVALSDSKLMRRWRQMVEAYAGTCVGDLGFSNFRDAVRAAKSYVLAGFAGGDVQGTLPSQYHINSCVPILFPPHRNVATHAGEILRSIQSEARMKIECAPYLVDLGAWLDWDSRCLPFLGGLRDFIHHYCFSQKSTTALLSGGVEGRLEGDIVEVGWTHFVKVPRKSYELRFDFNQAVPRDPLAAAAAAVGMVVADSGMTRAYGSSTTSEGGFDGLKLMAEYVQSKIMNLSVLQAAWFVLRALKSTPPVLRQTVAMPLFLEPYLTAKIRGDSAGEKGCSDGALDGKEQALFMLCMSLEDVAMLCQLGESLGRHSWMHLLRRPSSVADYSLNLFRHLASSANVLSTLCESEAMEHAKTRDPQKKPAKVGANDIDDIGQIDVEHCRIVSSTGTTLSQSSMPCTTERDVMWVGDRQSQDTLLDLDTAISRSGLAEDLEEDQEIDPATLKVCESVRAKFGLNVAMHAEARDALRNMHRVTNRSIQRLAADLYAKEVHFVLELVQNCDDCTFPDGTTPTLIVSLSATRLEFRSNERGFEVQNVLALCDIGQSTKAKQAGYIGQKGIGFKSVFKVTRRPEIHSRNFHFHFSAPSKDGEEQHGLGYIIPSPLPIPDPWNASNGTLVVLPLDISAAGGHVDLEDLRQSLSDIQASLLLFLNKLACIEIHDMSGCRDKGKAQSNIADADPCNAGTGRQEDISQGNRVYIRKMSKHEVRDGIVEVHDSYSSISSEKSQVQGSEASNEVPETRRTKWVVVERVFEAEEHAPREGVERSKLSIAIPLVPVKDLRRSPPPPRDVYAFLPLRSYGFRFILQGDFVVPSSREAVDASSPWNLWLREKVAALYVEAVLRLVNMTTDRERELEQERVCTRSSSSKGAVLTTTNRSGVAGRAENHEASVQGYGLTDEEEKLGWLEEEDCEGEIAGEEELLDSKGDHAKEHASDDESCYFLDVAFAMLPLPGQVSDFFAPVPAQVLSMLRTHEIVPTLVPVKEHRCSQLRLSSSIEMRRCALQFCNPERAVRRPLLQRVEIDRFTEVILWRLGYSFVHPRVTFPPGVEEALGCRSLGPELWCALLTEAAAVWESKASLGPPADKECSGNPFQFNRHWLIHVLAQMYTSRRYSVFLQHLKKLAIFPNVAGNLISLENGPMLQLMDDNAAEHSFFGDASFLARTLEPNFNVELQRNSDASKMAHQLGVTRVDADSFLRNHLLPALCSESTDKTSLISMLAFLKSKMLHMSTASKNALLKNYRGKLWLVNQCGERVLSGPILHIGREYDSSAPDPADFLPSYTLCDDNSKSAAWPTVSAQYLHIQNDAAGWLNIFRELGLSTFIYILDRPPHDSPELVHLLKQPEIESEEELERFKSLAVLFSDFWHEYAPYIRAARTQTGQTTRLPAVTEGRDAAGEEVDFLTRLRTAVWIPGSDGKLHLPCEVLSEDARALLGNKGVYCALPKKISSEFASDIGLAPPLASEHVLQLMEHLASNSMHVSVAFMHRLYSFLHRNATVGDKESMAQKKIIFVPTRSKVVTSAYKKGKSEFELDLHRETEGCWLTGRECVLSDKSYLLDHVKVDVTPSMHEIAAKAGTRALEKYYCTRESHGSSAAHFADLSQFFCEVLGVPKTPSDCQYVSILECVKAELHRLDSDNSLPERGRQRVGMRKGRGREALACALRVFVHWSYEAEDRDREGGWKADDAANSTEQDAVLQLRAFLASQRIQIPCCSARKAERGEQAAGEDIGWKDCTEVYFIDDRECSSCSFGCRSSCECQFAPNVLQSCAKLPPFFGITSAHSRAREQGDIVIKKLEERLLVFYKDVLGLPRLSDCLQSAVILRPPQSKDDRTLAAARIPAVVVALRALQGWTLSVVQSAAKGVSRGGGGNSWGRATAFSVKDRQELEANVKNLVVVLKADVLVCPVAVRRSIGSGEILEQWKGEPQRRECALDIVRVSAEEEACMQGTRQGSNEGARRDGQSKVTLATRDIAFRDRRVIVSWLSFAVMCWSFRR